MAVDEQEGLKPKGEWFERSSRDKSWEEYASPILI